MQIYDVDPWKLPRLTDTSSAALGWCRVCCAIHWEIEYVNTEIKSCVQMPAVKGEGVDGTGVSAVLARCVVQLHRVAAAVTFVPQTHHAVMWRAADDCVGAVRLDAVDCRVVGVNPFQYAATTQYVTGVNPCRHAAITQECTDVKKPTIYLQVFSGPSSVLTCRSHSWAVYEEFQTADPAHRRLVDRRCHSNEFAPPWQRAMHNIAQVIIENDTNTR